ncbi:hypothetical protein AAC387_Pa07g1610 [Persea americana]
MWRQRFPVKPENIVDERRGLKEWVICLAFPFGERLKRGESSSGIYAFLPTEMVTNFPFIIHADFVLSSSRETILLNNKWNLGILDCVGYAFSEAVVAAMKSDKAAPVSSMIKKAFCKPTEAGRIIPAFRNILSQLKAQGVPLESISSQRKHICHSALDLKRFDPALDFLGVQCFYDHWYAKCIQDCDLILKASENIYGELLVFIMKNWQTQSDHIGYMATLKYIDQHGNVALCSINSASRETYKICFGLTYGDHTWLSKCNMEFGWKEMYFLPNATWSALQRFGRVNLQRDAVLVPASGSKWGKLMISNPWTNENYVELGEQYARCCKFAGECSSKEMLHNFMVVYIKAKDIPELCPPGAHSPLAYSYLTGEQAFLLLDWIRHLRTDNSLRWNKFIENIQGKWLKTYAGYNSPKECLLSAEEERSIFAEMGNFHSHIPIIDEQFYESKIRSYESDLKYLGSKVWFSGSLSYDCQSSYVPHPMQTLNQRSSNTIDEAYEWDRFSKIADLPFIDDSYYGSVIYSFKDELAMMGVVVGFTKWSNVFTARMKLPKNPNVEASRYALSLLEQIRLLNSEKNESFAADFIKAVRNQRWLKTNIGFTPPKECFLSDPEWACLLHVLEVPLFDETFYKGRIGSFKEELKSLGVNVNFDDAKEKIFGQFKSLSSSCDLSKHKTLSALNCLKHFKGKENLPFEEFMNCLSNEKWLLTWHGYKCPKDSILFDSEWGPISEIAGLPFIDDAFYGNCISSYRDELKMMGVAVVLRDGCQFVAEGLKFPKEPEAITASSALSLLECIRILLAGSSNSALTEHFLLHMKSKWILTHMGYKTPDQCFLFNSSPSSVISKKWGGSLELEDAPFINEEFYGTDISPYREELKVIGVNVEAGEGCSSLAELLSCRTNFSAIRRIYRYLNKFKWMPPSSEKSDLRIWIPDHNGTHGEWVQPSVCVLSDVDNLFGASFLVLDKYYDRPLLPFFSMVFGVAKSPTTHDYLKLWNNWESRPEHQITTHECCSFWKYICSVWHANGGVAIVKGITKLPANTADGAVQLIDKRDLFIPDDLQPVQIFAEASANPLFVWCPPPSLPTIPKGEDFSMDYSLLNVLPTTEVIQKGLLKLVLAFLADVPVCTTVRHEIAQCLLKLSILETTEPIMVSYSLVLPSDKRHVNAKARKMVYWEKTSNKLIIQTPNKSDNKTIMEFACQFATVVSEGLLLKIMTSLIQQRKTRAPIFDGLYKLVRLGYFLDFNVDSIECLLKIENLEVLTEDEDFIASAFAVYDTALVVYKRKPRSVKEMSAPIAEKDRTKRRKR